jgi:3-dehydroquinate dehydratase-2
MVLNGPNLNLLGTREPEIYGTQTLHDIEADSRAHASTLGLEIDFRQSNSESELVDWVQASRGAAAGLIVNAGAYTHTSVALLDALKSVDLPIVEVHLSNIFRREEFRQHSYVSQAAVGIISGFGGQGYLLALDAMKQAIATKSVATNSTATNSIGTE